MIDGYYSMDMDKFVDLFNLSPKDKEHVLRGYYDTEVLSRLSFCCFYYNLHGHHVNFLRKLWDMTPEESEQALKNYNNLPEDELELILEDSKSEDKILHDTVKMILKQSGIKYKNETT